MDNFFEYLIAVIFIISFLSEIFKKKKGGTKVPPKTSNNNSTDDSVLLSDPLEELLKAKRQKIKNRQQAEQQTYTQTNVKLDDYIYNPEKEFNDNQYANYEKSKTKESLIQHYEKAIKVEKLIAVNNDKMNENSGYSEKEILDYQNKINETKKELLNPSNLKEFFIVSEILAKPISLRKKCQRIL